MAFFELVNTSSGNRIGDYDTQQQALCDVWTVIQRRGPEAVATIGLGYEGDDGEGRLIAEGDELVALATQATASAAGVVAG